MSDYEGLSDEEVKATQDIFDGVPLFNIGAFFLPPIWGPGHGSWITVLWYPLWLLADNLIYAGYSQRTPLAIGLAILTLVLMVAITALFSRLMQVKAFTRAMMMGQTKEEYLAKERKWAIGCVIGGLVLLAAATYYNLFIRGGA